MTTSRGSQPLIYIRVSQKASLRKCLILHYDMDAGALAIYGCLVIKSNRVSDSSVIKVMAGRIPYAFTSRLTKVEETLRIQTPNINWSDHLKSEFHRRAAFTVLSSSKI